MLLLLLPLLRLSNNERWAKVAHNDRTSSQVVVAVSREKHQGTPKSSKGPLLLLLLLGSAPKPGLKLLLLADDEEEDATTREPFRGIPVVLLLRWLPLLLIDSRAMSTLTWRTAGVVARWLLLFGLVVVVVAAAAELGEAGGSS